MRHPVTELCRSFISVVTMCTAQKCVNILNYAVSQKTSPFVFGITRIKNRPILVCFWCITSSEKLPCPARITSETWNIQKHFEKVRANSSISVSKQVASVNATSLLHCHVSVYAKILKSAPAIPQQHGVGFFLSGHVLVIMWYAHRCWNQSYLCCVVINVIINVLFTP